MARYPNVVLWMNGHRHRHKVVPHPGKSAENGFWEITTASLIDFPQQSRVVELVDNNDGSLSVFATLLDHSSPESVLHEGPQTPSSLAALSLELAMNRPGLDLRADSGELRRSECPTITEGTFLARLLRTGMLNSALSPSTKPP